MKKLITLFLAALLGSAAFLVAAADTSDADCAAFRNARWNWTDLGNTIQCGYAQLSLFESVQSISVVRFKAGQATVGVVNDSANAADTTSAIALRHNAKAAVNGSYFNVRTLYPTTFIKDDGGSSVLWTSQKGVLSHPYDNHRFDPFGQRTVPNIIYVR